MPNLLFRTIVRGARQFVVHDVLETTFIFFSYFPSLTPTTNIGVSSFGLADKITFLAPLYMCNSPFYFVRNTPVDSQI